MGRSAALATQPRKTPFDFFHLRKFPWPVLVATVVFLVGANLFWYALDLHHKPQRWLQPVFMLVGTVYFFGMVRLFGGVRWRDVSRDGRFVVVSSLLLFSLLWWFGRSGFYARNLEGLFPDGPFQPLYGFFYFSFNCVLARMVIPLVLIHLWFRKRPADFGYRFRGTFELWWVYVLLAAAVMLVVVFYASTLPVFQAKYPMCRRMIRHGTIPWEHFLLYQAAYGMIFVSGESFWRGYITFGLERDLGLLGLVFMIIPYTMAHYGKPLAETMGAMLTGLVLGYLALRHRSFWLGVAAHWGVALVMDLSAIARLGIVLT